MTAWVVVLVAGAGSVAFRLVPQVTGWARDLDPVRAALLRDAGVAALVAMATASVRGAVTGGAHPPIAVAAGLVAAGALAGRGRSHAAVVAVALVLAALVAQVV